MPEQVTVRLRDPVTRLWPGRRVHATRSLSLTVTSVSVCSAAGGRGRDSSSLLTRSTHGPFPLLPPSPARPHLLRGVLLLRPRYERRVGRSSAAAAAALA